MKTILVPTDFSVVSQNAVDYAAELAAFSNAKLLLLNTSAIPLPVVENPATEIEFDEINDSNRKLVGIIEKKIKNTHDNIEIETLATVGFMVEEILRCAKEKMADIIVMGSVEEKESSTVASNNTISVIRESACPVLVVPSGVKFNRPKRVALACDYSSILPEKVVKNFIEFVKLFDAKALILDVLKKTELVTYKKVIVEENLEETLHNINYTFHFSTGDNLIEELNTFIDKQLVDILVMIPHRYNFIEGLFHQSSTKKMALHSHIPLLTIHE